MNVPAEFTFFPEPRPAAIVVSHERSGTHFLMNACATCYGYVSLPWINFDARESILIDHSRQEIRDLLLEMVVRPMANVVKSHHTADFFTGELERLTQRYVFLHIVRNPVDVMLSFWRFMYHFQPQDDFGPLCPDPAAFACAPPAGRMLRYQTEPAASILERWSKHVLGWHRAAQVNPRVRLVRYEDLDSRFEETMGGLAPLLERPPQKLVRPARDFNVIRSGPSDPLGTGVAPDLDKLRSVCRETVGDTMKLLGYI